MFQTLQASIGFQNQHKKKTMDNNYDIIFSIWNKRKEQHRRTNYNSACPMSIPLRRLRINRLTNEIRAKNNDDLHKVKKSSTVYSNKLMTTSSLF